MKGGGSTGPSLSFLILRKGVATLLAVCAATLLALVLCPRSTPAAATRGERDPDRAPGRTLPGRNPALQIGQRPGLGPAYGAISSGDLPRTPSPSNDTAAAYVERAYAASYDSNQVVVVETVTHAVLGTMDVGASGCLGPYGGPISPDGAHVYIACNTSSSIAVIETASNSVVRTVTGTTYPWGITFARGGSYALISSYSTSTIYVVDTATYSIVQSIPASTVTGLAAHPYLDRVYAATYGAVLVVDTTTWTVADSVPFGGILRDVIVSPDGQWILADDSFDYPGVAVIDAGTNTLVTTIAMPPMLFDLDITPDGSLLFVAGGDSGVHVIDAQSFSLMTTIGGVGHPSNVAVTCDGTQLFVGGSSGYQMYIIDTQSLTVVDQVTMPVEGQYGIAACPSGFPPGVRLSPPRQDGRGGRGQIVAYAETVTNMTGGTDSLALNLGPHAWETNLSEAIVGPLGVGENAMFVVSVTVPVDAEWYSADTVTVTATSVASPTVYSDTATVTTEAYAPPEIDISPESLVSIQCLNRVTTQTLVIQNGEGVTLTFTMYDVEKSPAQGRLPVASGPAFWLEETPSAGSIPTGTSQEIAITFDSTGLQPGDYLADIVVDSNDPISPITVPVHLTVRVPQKIYLPIVLKDGE